MNQGAFVQPAWDQTSVAFERWLTVYHDYNPAAPPPNSAQYMGAYDALMVTLLAVTAAGSTDGAAIAAKIREVSNPPGQVVCPGQWRKAFRFLAQGKDINYEGALGPVDLDERGNSTGLTFGLFEVQPDGATLLTQTFGAAAQPACED